MMAITERLVCGKALCSSIFLFLPRNRCQIEVFNCRECRVSTIKNVKGMSYASAMAIPPAKAADRALYNLTMLHRKLFERMRQGSRVGQVVGEE
jgi:hypothetical protein